MKIFYKKIRHYKPIAHHHFIFPAIWLEAIQHNESEHFSHLPSYQHMYRLGHHWAFLNDEQMVMTYRDFSNNNLDFYTLIWRYRHLLSANYKDNSKLNSFTAFIKAVTLCHTNNYERLVACISYQLFLISQDSFSKKNMRQILALCTEFLRDDGALSGGRADDLALLLDLIIQLNDSMKQASIPVNEHLLLYGKQAAQALHMLSLGKNLTCFQGGDALYVKDYKGLWQYFKKRETINFLEKAGYASLGVAQQAHKFYLLADGGAINDARYHSIGAIELAVKDQAIMTSIGSGMSDKYFMHPAAHNVLYLKNHSYKLTYGEYAKASIFQHIQGKGGAGIIISHDYYQHDFLTLYERTLFCNDDANQITGEDYLEGPGSIPFTIRFHLHQKIKVTLQEKNNAALLKWQSKDYISFVCHGAILSIDDTKQGCFGKLEAAQQLVLQGETKAGQTAITWGLKLHNG